MSMSFRSLVLTGLAALSLAACSTTGERLSGVGGRGGFGRPPWEGLRGAPWLVALWAG